MATGTGTGFDLTKLESQFKKLDDELKKLMKEGTDFETKMNTIFNNMGQAGLQKFAQELAALRKGVVDFGKQKVGIKWDSEGLKKYIDDVNRLIIVIKQTQNATKKQGIKTPSIQGLKKELKEAQELLRIVKSAEKVAKNTTVKRQQTYAGSIRYSNNVKSLEQERQAIRNLEAAREKLKTTDKNYETKLASLNSRIKQHNKNISDATKGSKELQEKHRSLMDTSGQLARALAGVFSVSAIKGYINKIVEVRGEFELQHRSLQAIIQDVDKANKLWDKTVALAVKSPFRVKDLVTYTKQLAAYQIESDKLYDTTKKLADVSAGLGVDMNRLILAYGQVKAANFLRGTELRQFTEAGIPMLDELAKYFSEMENKFVSAADVFERISKRGVSFEDVDEVFNRITGEGGIFYQMQEKQSETLKGMINNLRDSIDLMLNDIGKSQEESLKGVIASTKNIVDNWRAVAVLIKQVGFAAAISALRNLVIGWNAVTLATFEGTAAMTGAAKAGATLRLSLQKLYATMKANPWAFIIGGIVAAGHAMWNYKKAIDEVNKKYDELSVSEIKKIEKLNDSLDKVNDSVEKNNSVLKNSKSTEEELTVARENNLKILNQLKSEYPEVFNAINQQNDGTINLTNAVEEQNERLRANIALQQEAKAKWNRDSQGENYKDVIEAQGTLQSQINKTKVAAYELGVKVEEAIRKGKITRDDATALFEYIKEIEKAKNATDILKGGLTITAFNDKAGKAVDFYKFREEHLKELESARVRYEGALRDFGVNLDEQMATFKIEMSKMETELERGEWLNAQLENLGVLDKEIKLWAKDYISKKIELEIVYPEPKKDEPNLKAWQKTYNAKFGDNIITPDVNESFAGFKEIKNEAEKQINVIERLQAEYKATKELIDAVNRAGGKKATGKFGAYEGTDLDKENKNLKQIMAQLDFFGAPYEKKTTGANKALQRLKEQIRLIRDAAKAYDDMRKLHDKAYADEQIVKEYGPAFKEAKLGDISGYAFGTRQDEQNNLEKLRASAEKTTGGVLELNKAIAQVGVNIADADQEILDKKLFDSISDIFSNYEISLEMDKLNIPKDAASKLFGFDAIDLDEIREQVMGKFGLGEMSTMTNEQIYNSTEFKNLSKERRDELRASLEKEENLQNEHLQENLKKYIEFSRKALSEKAKIKVDEINQLREIEKTFMATPLHDIETARSLGVSEEEIARMEAENAEISERNKLLAEYKALAKSSVTEKSQQDMKKIEWDEFRSSDVFINMFNDLDKASEHLIKHAIGRIEEFKKTWKDMPVAAAKEMTKKLNELQLALYDSGRVGRDKRAIEQELNDEIESRGLKGKANTTIGQKNLSESVQGENQAYTELIEKSNQRIALLQIINDLKSESKALDLELLGYNEEYIAGLGLTSDVISNSVDANNELIKTEKQNITNLNVKVSSNQKILNLIDKQKTKAAQLGEKWSKALGMAKDLYTSFQDIAEAANWDFSDEMAIFGEMGMSMADAVINAIALSSQLAAVETGAIAAGTALNTALGIVGWIVMAIQLVVSALNAISKMNQKKRAEQIEEEVKKVEVLAKKYEKLEESIKNAFSSAKLAQDSMDAQDNLNAQIESMENAIAVYEDADYDKLSDEEIEDWNSKKEELAELKEKASELKETVSSIATAGIFDDISSASDGFVDAWLTAFEETEDGMSGLEESFDDMLKTILKKQMSMAIMGPVMEQWKQSLGKYVNDKDTILTAEEAGQWAKEVKGSFGAVNANLQAYAEALEAEGINMHKDKENSLSGLSGGISGITEEQADILSAYWNAVRLSTDSIDNKIETIISKMDFGEGETDMIDNIRLIRINSNNIYELLQKVSTNGGSSAINVRLI